MTIQTVSTNTSYGGVQGVYRHASQATGTDMVFSVYCSAAPDGAKLPVVWYLSGLTCTHANVTEKGEFRTACAELGLIFVAPDTSPRGADVPGEPTMPMISAWAPASMSMRRRSPWRAIIACGATSPTNCPTGGGEFSRSTCSGNRMIGHSMGGHGALTVALRNPHRYRAVPAFAPIVAPSQVPWGIKALTGYLGPNKEAWRSHDTVALIEDGANIPASWSIRARPTISWPSSFKPELLQGGLRRGGHPADAAAAGGLRPQLLFHLDLHDRPSALACGEKVSRGDDFFLLPLWEKVA